MLQEHRWTERVSVAPSPRLPASRLAPAHVNDKLSKVFPGLLDFEDENDHLLKPVGELKPMGAMRNDVRMDGRPSRQTGSLRTDNSS
jgi:hypothetical protein